MMEKTDLQSLQRECWELIRTASNAIEGLMAKRAKEEITEVQLDIEIMRHNRNIQGALNFLKKEGL